MSEGYPLVTFSEYAVGCKYSYVGPESVNGGECCWHPDQETREQAKPKGKKHGCCWMGSCPLLYEADMFVLKNWDIDLYYQYYEYFTKKGIYEKNGIYYADKDLTLSDYGDDWMVFRDAENKLEDLEKALRKKLIYVLRQARKVMEEVWV